MKRSKTVKSVHKKALQKQAPKTFLTINKKLYRAIKPEKALTIAEKLSNGKGIYKVHVIYGKEKISPRKTITVENEGKYYSAKEAKQAIKAFLDNSLWMAI